MPILSNSIIVFVTYICAHCITFVSQHASTYKRNWDTNVRQDNFKKLGLSLGACNFLMGELYQSLEVWMGRRGGVLDRDMAPYSHVQQAVECGDCSCNRAILSLRALASACWMSSFHLNGYGQRHLCNYIAKKHSELNFWNKKHNKFPVYNCIMPNNAKHHSLVEGGTTTFEDPKTQHPALSQFWIVDVSSSSLILHFRSLVVNHSYQLLPWMEKQLHDKYSNVNSILQCTS